jgi:predicted ABC-type ATPase
MSKLYIIAGPNGAGKTTASYTILPEIFDCKEFVNADEIARGLSPFNQESVAIKAGKIMLQRIDELLKEHSSFAFETTLSSVSYRNLIKNAQKQGYEVTLLFLMLDSVELAQYRVRTRVKEGGHNIPDDVIKRRFVKGLKNLFNLYMPICDKWILINNSSEKFEVIGEGSKNDIIIKNQIKWNSLKNDVYGN